MTFEGTNLYAGNGNIAYIIPSLTGFSGSDNKVSEFPTTSGLMILNATWKVFVHEGGGTFEVALVTSDWNTSSVTYIHAQASVRISARRLPCTRAKITWI